MVQQTVEKNGKSPRAQWPIFFPLEPRLTVWLFLRPGLALPAFLSTNVPRSLVYLLFLLSVGECDFRLFFFFFWESTLHPPTSSCQVQMGRETAATVSQQKARAALWSVDWPDERKRSPATPNMWTPQGGRSAISPSAVSSLGSELPAKFPSVLLLSGPRVQCWRACFPSPCLPLVGPLSRRPRRSLLSREWLPSRGEAGATPRQSGHRSSTVAPTSASRVSTAQEQKSEDKKKKNAWGQRRECTWTRLQTRHMHGHSSMVSDIGEAGVHGG